MLVIETPFGNFGHPKDLLRYMKEEGIMNAKIHVKYCFEEVVEKDMSMKEVQKWAEAFVSPITGSLEEAIQWLQIGVQNLVKPD